VALVVHFFSPEPQEWLALTIFLTVIFGIAGIILFSLLYRRHRHPIPSRERLGLGFLQLFLAVVGLVALAAGFKIGPFLVIFAGVAWLTLYRSKARRKTNGAIFPLR
jgi:hypothetical protein